MGLLMQEINEIRDMLSARRQKKISHEEFMEGIAAYSQTTKKVGLVLQALALIAKNGRIAGKILKSNIIGDGEVIDLGISIGYEKVMCSIENGTAITREECLDLSGKAENYDVCKECGNAGVSKDLLLP